MEESSARASDSLNQIERGREGPSSGTRQSRKRKSDEFNETAFLDSLLPEIQGYLSVNLRPEQISDRIFSKYGRLIPKKVISDKIAY